MYINHKHELPKTQTDKNYSMYVFIYYKNNKRFCIGYYDFANNLWMDNDGMVINEDFLWCYLPVRQMKAFIRSLAETENNGDIF